LFVALQSPLVRRLFLDSQNKGLSGSAPALTSPSGTMQSGPVLAGLRSIFGFDAGRA
jgi:hypothetical protein